MQIAKRGSALFEWHMILMEADQHTITTTPQVLVDMQIVRMLGKGRSSDVCYSMYKEATGQEP